MYVSVNSAKASMCERGHIHETINQKSPVVHSLLRAIKR